MMEPLLWDAEWRTGIDGDYLLEQIDAAFTRLEAGLIQQPYHVHVDSCGAKGCEECYPIPTVYVFWERFNEETA